MKKYPQLDRYKQLVGEEQLARIYRMEAADDIKAMEILKDIQEKAGADPDIHLPYDPDVITHPIVNAFQRYSSVVMYAQAPYGSRAVAPTWKASPRARQEAVSLPRNGVAIPRCAHKSS